MRLPWADIAAPYLLAARADESEAAGALTMHATYRISPSYQLPTSK